MNVSVYYETESVTLLHGDAREALDLVDKVDLIVTDPPYGVKWESNFRKVSYGAMAGDSEQDCGRIVIEQALRHLENHRHIYVFGPFTFDALPIGGTTELVWDKVNMGMGNLALPWAPAHERIAFGFKESNKKAADSGRGRLSARIRRGSVLTYARPNATAVRHPSEKPVPLLRELIESSSCFGDAVLDPFAGSGSTLVAAVLEGRKAIGIELEERWCELSATRLRALETTLQTAA